MWSLRQDMLVTRLEICICIILIPYTYEYILLFLLFRACFACFACIFAVIFGICHSQVMIFFVYRLNRGGRLSNLKLINCKTPNYARFYLVTELNCFTYAHRSYTGSYLVRMYIYLIVFIKIPGEIYISKK